ncbi:MAG: hypothetical protein PHC97_01430 [Patescibacteria group bacterium]|nr:hypothetical protein [Patescibacteria group bacterium]
MPRLYNGFFARRRDTARRVSTTVVGRFRESIIDFFYFLNYAKLLRCSLIKVPSRGNKKGGDNLVNEKLKLRQQALFLVGGSYKGENAKLILAKIRQALEDGSIHIEELGVTLEQLKEAEEKIKKETLPRVQEMSEAEAKDLASGFGKLWQQYQTEADADQKKEILALMKTMWPRLVHGVKARLIVYADLGLEDAGEYFVISDVMHQGGK